MATIKAIEGRSVHQIQSGQVIVDLNSVVKELVENSLDAGATSIDVRFKSQGLEAIEVQDNGSGIARDDYETLALKHYTSKLAAYNDLTDLNTFGFRGEAISSLCALSNLHVVTARDGEAPKGTKLEYEQSGKLKSSSVAATQKGTLVVVEGLFQVLPVRRRELEKNIKREYSKVINVLNAYACVSIGVRFSISQQTGKGKKTVVFSTKNNLTTKENIANVYGAKTIIALVPLDLDLEMQPSGPSQVLKDLHHEDNVSSRKIKVEGHISKPVHGEGRQTPDRQMFFVNSRPCGLPQVAKAFNEVYRSYNVTQSPFVFANFKMDTNAYDVNVSPDKRTIMLHDQQRLLETLKDALLDLFESQDQTVPTHQPNKSMLSALTPLSTSQEAPSTSSTIIGEAEDTSGTRVNAEKENSTTLDAETPLSKYLDENISSKPVSTSLPSSTIAGTDQQPEKLISKFTSRHTEDRPQRRESIDKKSGPTRDKLKLARRFEQDSPFHSARSSEERNVDGHSDQSASKTNSDTDAEHGGDGNNDSVELEALSDQGGPSQYTNRIRPADTASAEPQTHQLGFGSPKAQGAMTFGPTKSKVATGSTTKRRRLTPSSRDEGANDTPQPNRLLSSLLSFAAPGARLNNTNNQRNRAAVNDGGSALEGSSGTQIQDEVEEDVDHNSLEEGISTDGEDGVSTEQDSNEQERKAVEEARIQQMVQNAENSVTRSSQENEKRAAKLSRRSRDKIFSLVRFIDINLEELERQQHLRESARQELEAYTQELPTEDIVPSQASAEERLSLTISKSDFAQMRIVGQFNLGFILAVRPLSTVQKGKSHHSSDELFIIDQHASDEIFNFHRLSDTTTLTPQPLVRPHQLQLTAIEEETVLDHKDASLAKNGFNVDVDTSGAKPVGERCRLLTLPTSKETVFDTRDLEELLAMLSDVPAPCHHSPPLPDVDTSEHLEGVPSHRTLSLSNHSTTIVRPTKVRRMLAMRACRSSIMVGKALTRTGMARVVKHMGEIERPWNCPHGRPTMRHLSALGNIGGWNEWGSSIYAERDTNIDASSDGVNIPNSSVHYSPPPSFEGPLAKTGTADVWRNYVRLRRNDSEESDAKTDLE